MTESFSFPALLFFYAGTFFVSFFVAAIGPTGGLQMAVVAATLPPQIAIPMHAWITGFSAAFRAINLFDSIEWKYVSQFSVISVAASSALVLIALNLDSRALQFLIGTYIAGSALGQLFRPNFQPARALGNPYVAGAITGALSVFIGATGPLVFSFLSPVFPAKEKLQATFSACLVVQHLSKIALFGIMGASILHLPLLLIAALAASWLGTYAGHRLLISINENLYRKILCAALIASGLLLMFGLKVG